MISVKKKASTRLYLDEALKARNIDAIDEMCKLYAASDLPNKIKICEIWWDRLFPKCRPEDNEGNSEEGNVIRFIPTDEQLEKIVKAAREKNGG